MPIAALNELEERYLLTHEELDMEYIEATADFVARRLEEGEAVEAAFQPGDGTFYGLVFVPLPAVMQAPPRVRNGREWDRHSCRGQLVDGGGQGYRLVYQRGATLIALVQDEGVAYPLNLRDRPYLDPSYIAEHWNVTAEGSAAMLAMLFRLVAEKRDELAAGPRAV